MWTTPVLTDITNMRLLGAKYKTLEGARKRAGFENSMAPGEYRRGHKAHLYVYRTIEIDGKWRVARIRDLGGEHLKR